MVEFRYYMLRVRHETTAGATVLGGVVEQLGTGEKRRFATVDELHHVLEKWTESGSNMPPASTPRNDETPEAQAQGETP